MVHAFVLVVLLGTGETMKQLPNPMYFRSINVCQYYAKSITKQYGNYNYRSLVPPEHRITAYCKPVYTKDGEYIYDH
tara:strand:+ start:961 stop:1191 length:231 start_codon:yes stop_codon:yes gene_type:complete